MAGVAWYDVHGPRWLRDIFVILHPPYTLWHLSYVPIGAALAPRLDWGVLGWTVLAFFLAMGIGGHCLDELNGRPLRTQFPSWGLWLAAALSVAGAIAIGIFIGMQETLWVLPCIIFGGFIVIAYNLEWPSRRMKESHPADIIHTPLSHLPVGYFHKDIWFGIAWGAFPTITAYIAQSHTISWPAALVALFALAYSMAQRKLSLHSRFWRRKVTFLRGDYWLEFGGMGEYAKPITKETIIGPADLVLKYLNGAIVVVGSGLLLLHV